MLNSDPNACQLTVRTLLGGGEFPSGWLFFLGWQTCLKWSVSPVKFACLSWESLGFAQKNRRTSILFRQVCHPSKKLFPNRVYARKSGSPGDDELGSGSEATTRAKAGSVGRLAFCNRC